MSPRPLVTVFGAASAQPGDGDYEQAVRLGSLLAGAGFDLATGGYRGLMEAASRGAAEAGGWVLGFTCERVEGWRGVKVNAWVKEEVRCATVRDRMVRLIEAGEALIAMPGGIGTLSEIALAWSLLQTGEISPRPLIAVGKPWGETLGAFLTQSAGYIRPEDARVLTLVPDVDQAVAEVARRRESRDSRREMHG